MLLYGGVYYKGFVERGGIFDGLRSKMAQQMLNQLVAPIELYRLQHGSYPSSLQELQNAAGADNPIFILDPSQTIAMQSQFFFYQRLDTDHYYLRGTGPDRTPFTSDDIVPTVANPLGSLGLLIAQQK